MQTVEERKRHNVAGFVFSEGEILDFMCVRDNLAKRKEAHRYNKEVRLLKELALKYGVLTPDIERLKPKEVPI